MSVRPSPTVRARRLRYELRRIREERGLTIDDVVRQAGGDWSASALSRWETGERRIRPVDLRALLDLYDIQDEHREVLLTFARQAREKGWWHSFGGAIPSWFEFYIGLETEATSIHVYEAELVHGLLQTPEYYRAFLRVGPAAAQAEEIERKIAVRTARQERLTSDDPPKYWAVLNEAVIRRVVGGSETMRTQLQHIAKMAELPHVDVQVLPFKAGAHPAMDGSFEILGFPEPADPDVVYLESQTGSLYLEKEAELQRYTTMFTAMIAKALDPDESRALIAQVASEF
ncbi:helix-turn-helix transcriptional regulator [Actinoallomurus vinaceus]|uniref:Helix-turn-helix transcriptional regulator n=1 Tax=Actinoallomurus vinaceus TaxID=1080074 RepID=A0ABP8UJ94_9ACTN